MATLDNTYVDFLLEPPQQEEDITSEREESGTRVPVCKKRELEYLSTHGKIFHKIQDLSSTGDHRRYIITMAKPQLKRWYSSRDSSCSTKANIVLIGAGWWSQGWHLPHLHRNEEVTISAIVDSSPHPTSNLDPNLESLTTLATKYNCPIFHSLSELLESPIGKSMDGALVCTPHATHYAIGVELIQEAKRRYEEDEKNYKPLSVLMEKPMTTDVDEAIQLHTLLLERKEADKHKKDENDQRIGGGIGCFLVNHSANFRPQARAAHELIETGKLGDIRHVTAFFASPLSWIFDDPSNTGWNEKRGSMLGNGFAWGQQSHILSWIYHVAGVENLVPSKVFCHMTKSDKTGADVSHAATVICSNGATFSLSGTSLLPGNAHSDPPVAKRIEIKIFGTKGAVIYRGDDRDPSSGKLEWLRGDDEEEMGAVEVQCPDLGFEFEDLDQDGNGPASLQCFIDSCLGLDYYVGADCLTGLRSVQTIEAMYRSHVSGNCESIVDSTEES
eukprot:scaffold2199_cov120-Skeletonema_dohrnii-CCMP3373.AAC.5